MTPRTQPPQGPDERDLLHLTRAVNHVAVEADGVVSALIRLVATELDCAGCAAVIMTKRGRSVVASTGSLADPSVAAQVADSASCRIAMAERRVILVNDPDSHSRDPNDPRPAECNRMLVAPLVAESEVVGVLVAINPRDRGFHAGDAAIATRLADLVTLDLQQGLLASRKHQREQEAAAMATFVHDLGQSLELDHVANFVAEQFTQRLSAAGALVFLGSAAEFLVAAASGVAGSDSSRRRGAEALAARAVGTNSLVRERDLFALAHASGAGTRNDMAVPLAAGGRQLGAVVVFGTEASPFTGQDERTLCALAVHARAAVEAAQLHRLATQSSRRAEVLSLVGRSLAQTTDAPTFFGELTRVALEGLGASGLTVFSIDPASSTISVAYIAGIGAAHLSRVIPQALTAPGVVSAIVNGVAAFVEDVLSTDATLTWNAVPGEKAPENIVSFARLPLLVEGRVRGALTLSWEKKNSFPAEERALLFDFGGQVAMALGKAQQLATEQRTRENAEAVAAIARAGLEASDAQSIAVLALEAIKRAVPSLGTAIGLMDSTHSTLCYLAASQSLAALGDTRFPMTESAAALTERELDQVSLALMHEGQVVPAGCYLIPLTVREQTIGVLLSVPFETSAKGTDRETLRNLAVSLALAADVVLLNEEEKARRARENMLATALAKMDQAVLILGLDRRVLYANAAAILEYGYTFDSRPSIAFEQLVDAATVARRVGTSGAPEGGGMWEAEHMHRRRDGSLFPASVLLTYIRDAGNFPVGQVVTIRNLTAERRIEERLRQSEKLAALGELVAGVAHELNNPLAGISTFAQLLLEEDLGDEQRESVRLIKREADRAVGVIRDLLTFSRKTGRKQSQVDVNEMVALTLRLRGYALRSAGIDVQLELAPSLPPVPGDGQRLQQVLLNLIINAEYALHGVETKRLVVRSERTANGVCLVVGDSGAGMDEETRQRIFEPFFTTKPAGEGTGLGLSVSYGIIHALGGLIDVQSAPGEGTVFRVELPLRPASDRAMEA